MAALALPDLCRASELPASAVQHSCVFETVPGVSPAERYQRPDDGVRFSGSARLSSSALELTVTNAKQEELTLSIPRSQLSADLTGYYRLAGPLFSTSGVKVIYCYRAPADAGEPARVYSNTRDPLVPAHGSVIITGYDLQSQQISGSYSVNLEFVPSPKGPTTGAANWRVLLTGQFDNLRLQ